MREEIEILKGEDLEMPFEVAGEEVNDWPEIKEIEIIEGELVAEETKEIEEMEIIEEVPPVAEKTKFCEMVAIIGLKEIFDKKTLAP